MAKIKSLDELRRIKTSASDLTAARSSNAVKVIVGMGTCGIAAGAREVMDAVLKEIEKRGLKDVSVQTTGCIGMCQEEPLLDVIYPNKGRITYGRVTPEDVPRIVSEHVVNGRIVEDLVIARVDD
ncbi:NADH dehydrogenase I, F subunit [Dethiosulfovibrio peptidovorans DSM 11002]|uniref:NADH dehydrogenase I, F subunit n=1 Tax=Dethiosulfovibrio peptidovorans DSM 11002 TaxID=469381 RepID=D2Z2N1_9BACT|nr:(2Fe-2S) ferredoxin domain-containing protein [Dethiosulfovibrio peptidovorans]EFC92044.1 NADH dehydrogenase I, F subunit [Dethiosulfovibrio peptidovorans DSM 11002]